MNFKENILSARKKKGWSQVRAAQELGIKRCNLGAYEEGRAFPRLVILRKIVTGYEVSAEDLYSFIFGSE